MTRYRFEAELWRHDGDAPWHFVTLPSEVAEDIEETTEPRPFGSVAIRATLGESTWETSLFPDKGGGTYVLPVKRSVRAAESLSIGDVVVVELESRYER